jgi:hypothetical protein
VSENKPFMFSKLITNVRAELENSEDWKKLLSVASSRQG